MIKKLVLHIPVQFFIILNFVVLNLLMLIRFRDVLVVRVEKIISLTFHFPREAVTLQYRDWSGLNLQ